VPSSATLALDVFQRQTDPGRLSPRPIKRTVPLRTRLSSQQASTIRHNWHDFCDVGLAAIRAAMAPDDQSAATSATTIANTTTPDYLEHDASRRPAADGKLLVACLQSSPKN